MPNFRYTARDADDARLEGEIDADGPEQAAARLELQGLRVERIDLAAIVLGPPAMSAGDASVFVGQLAGLATAGLPLPAGLRALAEELPSGPLRRAFAGVSMSLEAGATLEQAVGAEGRRMPAHLRGLVLAGLRTGRLGEILGRYVDASRAGAEIRRRIWLSLAYPIVLMGAAVTLYVFACYSVIEGFRSIFADFGISVPVVTRLVLNASSAIAGLNWRALPGLAAVVAVVWAAERLLLSPARRRRLAGEIPLFGPLFRWTSLAEFSGLLGLLIQGEIPLPEAVTLAADAVRDPDLAEAGRRVRGELEAGQALSSSLGHRRQFPPGYARLVGWAERNRSLPEALEVLAEMYEARAKAHASFLGSVGGALAMIVILGGVTLVAGGLMSPFLGMMRSLSGG